MVLMDFPENEESAEKLLYPNEITGENSISDFVLKQLTKEKVKRVSFIVSGLKIPCRFRPHFSAG